MNKLFCLFFVACIIVSLAACNAEPAETEAPKPIPEKVEKKDFSNLKGIVDDYTTWYEEFMQLPIASADMTEEQLRSPLDTVQNETGLRMIPYCAVGQPGGLLVAKRFPSVKLDQRQCSALVAFATEQIGRGEVFQALAGGNI